MLPIGLHIMFGIMSSKLGFVGVWELFDIFTFVQTPTILQA